jgi:hypothetical protein
MIQPIARGGLNLMSPALKTTALFLSNFLRHSSENPFISQYLNIANPPYAHHMPKVPYVKFALLELSYIPLLQMQSSIPSKIIYQQIVNNITISHPRGIQRNQPTIWKNIASKHIPSQTRSLWFINKMPVSETLFNQNRVDPPFCQHCPTQIDTLVHRYTTCGQKS